MFYLRKKNRERE